MSRWPSGDPPATVAGIEDNYVVEVSYGTPTSIRELVISYLRAVERFRAQDARSSSYSPQQLHRDSLARAALFEALNWADTIDQYLREGPRNSIGTNRDKEWASHLAIEQQQVAQAFQRVRNRVHHQWWQAIAVRIQQVDGEQVNAWVWGHLPPSGKGRTRWEKAGDAAYEKALQGRRLLVTLDELAEIFWSKRTWQIGRADLEQPGHSLGSKLAFDPDRDDSTND